MTTLITETGPYTQQINHSDRPLNYDGLDPKRLFHGLCGIEDCSPSTDVETGSLRFFLVDPSGELVTVDLGRGPFYTLRGRNKGGDEEVIRQHAASKSAGLSIAIGRMSLGEPYEVGQPDLGEITAARVIHTRVLSEVTGQLIAGLFDRGRPEGDRLDGQAEGLRAYANTDETRYQITGKMLAAFAAVEVASAAGAVQLQQAGLPILE